MGDKAFKRNNELIDLLISRGVDISTPQRRSYAKKALQHIGYYSLVNGYNQLFLAEKQPEDKYIQGTTIEQMVALYDFDRELRQILFRFILPFETNVKNLIAYRFSKIYGHETYMVYKNFDTGKKEAYKNIPSVIADFQHQLSSRATDPAIMHYLTKYGYVPLWVMNSILTFGQISKFYAVMKQSDRQDVSKVFRIQDHEMESILYYLSVVRNFCAHGNRVYCFRSRRPLTDLAAHGELGITRNNGTEYDYGKRDLFACMISLRYVLSKTDFRKLIKEIKRLLQKTSEKLIVIGEEDLLNVMGFPGNWDEKLLSLVSVKTI